MASAPARPRPASAGPWMSAAARVAKRHRAEKKEGERRADEAVEDVGRVDRAEGDDRPGGGKDARNIGRRNAGEAGQHLAAAFPLSRNQQHGGEKCAEQNPEAGPSQPSWMEYWTRKIPPSASATPPAQTTQRVPKRSSKLGGVAGIQPGGGGAGGVGEGGRYRRSIRPAAAVPSTARWPVARSRRQMAVPRPGAPTARLPALRSIPAVGLVLPQRLKVAARQTSLRPRVQPAPEPSFPGLERYRAGRPMRVPGFRQPAWSLSRSAPRSGNSRRGHFPPSRAGAGTRCATRGKRPLRARRKSTTCIPLVGRRRVAAAAAKLQFGMLALFLNVVQEDF